MADADLDDFFAKKDKSKKKSKSKIKPDDILAQQGEAPIEKPKKKKKPKTENVDINAQNKENKNEEEEWEVKVEEETDYSGLRIQTLQVSNKEEDENEHEDGAGDGEDGEGGDGREGVTGPWSKNPQTNELVAPPPPKETEPTTEKPADPNAGKVQGGKYIPPARRGAGGADSPAVIVTSSHKRKPKIAPNLQSESDFPTLGGPSELGAGAVRFEEVRFGGRQVEDPSKKKMNLQLDNKFDALQAD